MMSLNKERNELYARYERSRRRVTVAVEIIIWSIVILAVANMILLLVMLASEIFNH